MADAIQNAVLRAYRAFDRYHDDASFRAWMLKILTNEIFSINRKRGRIAKFEVPLDPEEMDDFAELVPAAEEIFSSWETLADALDEDILRALQALNEVERAVLLLRAATQLSEQKVRDEIAQQVVTGRARVLSLAHQLATARLSLSDAQENLRLDQERKEFGVGIVLETIVAEQDLTRARNDYLRIVADYNKVQYDLLRALGQISTDLSASRVTRSR